MAPIHKRVENPPKRLRQNLIHSGVVFGGVSSLYPSRLMRYDCNEGNWQKKVKQISPLALHYPRVLSRGWLCTASPHPQLSQYARSCRPPCGDRPCPGPPFSPFFDSESFFKRVSSLTKLDAQKSLFLLSSKTRVRLARREWESREKVEKRNCRFSSSRQHTINNAMCREWAKANGGQEIDWFD